MNQTATEGHREPRSIVFELCAETLDACWAAHPGGADRIELCARLEVGGVTPAPEITAAAVEGARLPVHVLVRPSIDDFYVSAAIVESAKRSLLEAKQLGAAGVVLGFLRRDGTVDRDCVGELVELARPMDVTFHRAFDTVADQQEALEEIVRAGCKRILTSGGAPDVITGAQQLQRLYLQAAGRIDIAAGGGLRVSNASVLAASWAGQHHHGSLGGAADGTAALTERIRTTTRILRT